MRSSQPLDPATLLRRSFLVAALLLAPTAVFGQNAGTCADPVDLSGLDESRTHILTLDTTDRSDNQQSECSGDELASGPDIVLDFRGLPADGLIQWEADFEAIVYYREGRCDVPCAAASTSGSLAFDSNYRFKWDDGSYHVAWETPIIIVDGVNGASR